MTAPNHVAPAIATAVFTSRPSGRSVGQGSHVVCGVAGSAIAVFISRVMGCGGNHVTGLGAVALTLPATWLAATSQVASRGPILAVFSRSAFIPILALAVGNYSHWSATVLEAVSGSGRGVVDSRR